MEGLIALEHPVCSNTFHIWFYIVLISPDLMDITAVLDVQGVPKIWYKIVCIN